MRSPRGGIAVSLILAGLLGVAISACGASDSTGVADSGAAGACPIGGTATPCAATGTPSPSTSSATTSAASSSSCNAPATQRTDDFHQAVTLTTLPDGLKSGDITPGSGAAAGANSSVVVEYTGWLQDGTSFDSSRKAGGMPFPVQLGAGAVIHGWDEGVPGMKVGGVRRLVIPPSLGYGAQAQGPIPANSTLTFDIELLAVC